MPCFLIIFYVFSSAKLENRKAEQILPRGRGGGWGGVRFEVAQIMYTHVSKCKTIKNK
jgi:hypothetical protein